MTNANEQIKKLNIKELLSGDECIYQIPMYQRNFDWGEKEIVQLIQDIVDTSKSKSKPNYYLGTLVVYRQNKENDRTVYEIIDGQQRLTTLVLLASYLKNSLLIEKTTELSELKQIVDFENRASSKNTLDKIFDGKVNDLSKMSNNSNQINSAILEGYHLIKRNFPQSVAESNVQKFNTFLLEKVIVMRVEAPQETDLNHYFEIMNTRGEQLEKHEILKVRMMEKLKTEDKRKSFAAIWDACSNMDKYIQLSFSGEQSKHFFSSDDVCCPAIKDFDTLVSDFFPITDNTSENDADSASFEQVWEEIITDHDIKNIAETKESEESFNSIINFPNFLLQVLLIQTEGKSATLNDKNLIETFETHVLAGDGNVEANVKAFAYNLLLCKFLFDQYIVKRENKINGTGWSLKCLKTSEQEKSYINKKITMLQAAFHVSSPTNTYKYWLTAALLYLHKEALKNSTQTINDEAYLNHLKSIANAFLFQRNLSSKGADYLDIIFENNTKSNKLKAGIFIERNNSWRLCKVYKSKNIFSIISTKLTFNNITNNFVFNFLDYLLWEENEKKEKKDSKIANFEFTFRSSIDHHYPQNPIGGVNIPEKALHSFGNLCLISSSKNSSLGNRLPNERKKIYKDKPIDSIKQYTMMQEIEWNDGAIKAHATKMIKLLLLSYLESIKP